MRHTLARALWLALCLAPVVPAAAQLTTQQDAGLKAREKALIALVISSVEAIRRIENGPCLCGAATHQECKTKEVCEPQERAMVQAHRAHAEQARAELEGIRAVRGLMSRSAVTRIVSYSPPRAVVESLKGRGVGGIDWTVQTLAAARGPVNLDCYGVSVARMPSLDGRVLNSAELLSYVRLNLNRLLDPHVGEMRPYEDRDAEKWKSDDPLSAVMSWKMKLARINLEDGSVVTSEQAPDHWIFSTVWTTGDGWHPVSGQREFGFTAGEGEKNPNVVFYTRAADRTTTLMDRALSGQVFDGGHRLWLSYQQGLARFVNEHGGAAVILPAISERHDWEQVRHEYYRPGE
jgi:hypothetical protein